MCELVQIDDITQHNVRWSSYFSDDIFKSIFLYGNVFKGQINKKPALNQIVAWWQTDDNPLAGPMLSQFNDAYMHDPVSITR